MAETISISKNGGYSKKVFMIDSKNDIFDISTEVYFDSELDEFRDYNGKKFEIILKANEKFDPNTEKFNLEEYYFVGIGTWEFDIGLGVAKYDAIQDKTYKSFLAAFGEYNSKTIKTETWYKLRVRVIADRIQIYFNERNQKEKLVISYDISRSRQQKEERYLRGEFEELVYVISGLESLDIIYPDKLQQATNENVSKRLYNEELVKNTRPVGPLSGIVIFNPFTYVSEVKYKAKTQGTETFDGPTKTTERTSIISDIIKKYKLTEIDVKSVGKTMSETFVLQIGSNLFYQLQGKEVNLFSDEVKNTFVFKNRVIVHYEDTNKNTIQILNENFDIIKNIFVKDNAFNEDHIYKYLQLTNRSVQNVYANENELHIVFEDIE